MSHILLIEANIADFTTIWSHCTCKHFDCHGNSKAFVGSAAATAQRLAHSLAYWQLSPITPSLTAPPSTLAAATCHIWLSARTMTVCWHRVRWVRQLKMRRARLSCRLLVDDVAKYTHTEVHRHIYMNTEVVVGAVFAAVRPPLSSCCWQHNLRYWWRWWWQKGNNSNNNSNNNKKCAAACARG